MKRVKIQFYKSECGYNVKFVYLNNEYILAKNELERGELKIYRPDICDEGIVKFLKTPTTIKSKNINSSRKFWRVLKEKGFIDKHQA